MQTLKVTPEVVSFIKAGAPTPQTQSPALLAAKPEAAPKPPAAVPQPLVRPKVGTAPPKPEPSPLVCITTRLPGEISKAVFKAASQRKLERIEPYTQQEIIAEALKLWLQKNGFMPAKG